jgi:hypothetical protein
MVMADGESARPMFTERVSVTDFESNHFRAQFLERLGWAVSDASAAEQAAKADRESSPK